MNFYLIAFVITAILVGLGGGYTFFSSSRPIAGALFLVGAILVFVYYGMRWFGSTSPLNPSPAQWPPLINTCPDFLTYFKRTKSDGTTTDTCVDRIGVSKNNALQVFPTDENVNQDNDAYFFTLPPKGSDANAYQQTLCNQTIQYGLTWEGVTDGESCLSANGQGQAVVPSGQASGSCPS